jgi:hypothetical protein
MGPQGTLNEKYKIISIVSSFNHEEEVATELEPTYGEWLVARLREHDSSKKVSHCNTS